MIQATSRIWRYDVHNFFTFKLVKTKQQQLQESRDTQVVTLFISENSITDPLKFLHIC